jgi:hypothetical protein
LSWVRLDDGFADHPKVLSIGKTALAVHVWAICYCARHLTDGFVSLGALSGCPWVSKRSALESALGRLEGAGLWKRQGNGFEINDYLDFNPTAAKVKAKRAAAAERQARWRDNQEKRLRRDSNGVTPLPRNAHPDPALKAGEADAPSGAPLPLDDCMRCGEFQPLRDIDGLLLCEECERAAA